MEELYKIAERKVEEDEAVRRLEKEEKTRKLREAWEAKQAGLEDQQEPESSTPAA